MSSADETGLNLFHDNASAAGNFPTSLRGYDRSSVDEYVRTLERRAVEVQQRNRDLDGRVRKLEDELASAQKAPTPSDHGQADRGQGASNAAPSMQAAGRAGDVLRAADEEARELVKRAQLEVQQIRETARREAASTRGQADRSATDLHTSQRAEIDGLRKRVQSDAVAQVTKARDEAGRVVAAARREAEAVRLQANQEINAHRESSRLQAGAMLAQAQREVADLRAKLAKEREDQSVGLKTEHGAASAKLAALLTEAQQFHARSGEQLAKESEEAARIRTEALAEAERTRIRVARESEDTIGNAKRQAAALQQRMHEQFTQGKDRLRRETELLNDRKKAVLAQLSSLSEWAQQGASGFPDVDPDDDLADLEKAFGDSDSADSARSDQPEKAADTKARTADQAAQNAPSQQAQKASTEDGPATDGPAKQAGGAVSTTVTTSESSSHGSGTTSGASRTSPDDALPTDPDATVIRPRPAS